MSEEKVELARAAIDAFNRGDLEWLLERIDNDFVFDWTRSRGPLAAIYPWSRRAHGVRARIAALKRF
jgi:ketosteroid isomerase-like protein